MCTIVAAQLSGLSTATAAEFSFLLALPTLGAATLYEGFKARHVLLASVGARQPRGGARRVVLRRVGRHRELPHVPRARGLEPFGWYRIVRGGRRPVGPRKLRLAVACLCATAIACAPGRAANVAPLSTAPAGPPSAASPAPAPPALLDPEGALGREPTEGAILVRTSVLRGHPVGVHVGPLFGWWRGWRSTLRSVTRDPVADLDWLAIVGPTDPAGQRMLARVAAGAPDAAIDGRLVALQARSAEPAESHVDGRLPAAAARLDGTLRVVFRPQKRFVAAAAVARGPELSHVLSGARLLEPQAEASEAVRFDVIHPQDGLRLLPPAFAACVAASSRSTAATRTPARTATATTRRPRRMRPPRSTTRSRDRTLLSCECSRMGCSTGSRWSPTDRR